jgi:D-erythro-7,8-dihydroneopterin triphosphate epimerase
MSFSDAIIEIQNLRLRTYIGFNPEEQAKKQDIVVNAEIHYPAALASQSDNVEDAFNYKTLTKKVIALIEEGRFLLLEKLVKQVLDLCAEHHWINFAKVTIDKPHALRFADSVSLTMHYSKDPQE